jgi:hypothetical protein
MFIGRAQDSYSEGTGFEFLLMLGLWFFMVSVRLIRPVPGHYLTKGHWHFHFTIILSTCLICYNGLVIRISLLLLLNGLGIRKCSNLCRSIVLMSDGANGGFTCTEEERKKKHNHYKLTHSCHNFWTEERKAASLLLILIKLFCH